MTKLSERSLDQVDSEDRIRVLGIIDSFRALGIQSEISLPQLVVVGDQSSGKSSLLEGLTGLNFPIASELCTRFATQIILRRSSNESRTIRVSILPGPSSSSHDDQRLHLEAFSRTIEGDGLSATDFSDILDEAAACMGLPIGANHVFEDLPKRFSDDVLRIELSGPEHHHLSVVDVPGLFHNPTKFQTQEDLDLIRSLLQTYVTDKRTIILAVMDGRNNLANQEVFRMAKAADPGGKRTVGIITKCDALQAGDEATVLAVAQNTVEHLNHGWFCVKNRSTQDIHEGVTIKQRHANEKAFFHSEPWNQLSKSRVGISSLKRFLGQLLYDHIQGEFPALVGEIRSLVQTCRTALEGLGPARQTTIQQRQYLSRASGRYQKAAHDALRGNYDSIWEPMDARKLRMHVRRLNGKFSDDLAKRGHRFAFQKADNTQDEEFANDSGYDAGCDEKVGMDNIYTWIRLRYMESRGAELPGTVNPALLESLFRQQARNWRTIADDHIREIDQTVSNFNSSTMADVYLDESVRREIERRNDEIAQQSRANAQRQLRKVLEDETTGILQTVNHYYADNLTKARLDRFVARLKDFGLVDGRQNHINFAHLTSAIHLGNDDQAIFDIHDILKAYYKVARKRFCDNVVMQVVEGCFLSKDSSVQFISPEYIGELADDELSSIAAETYATASTRNETLARLERLERALIIAEEELRRR